MVSHVIDQVSKIGADRIITVVGHGAEQVKRELEGRTEFVLQRNSSGTGHAVLQAKVLLGNEKGAYPCRLW